MIRTMLIPNNNEVLLAIPKDYIGKRVEVLLYILEEVEIVSPKVTTRKKPSDFAGSLSLQAANDMIKYVEQSRNEWERDF